MAELLTKRFFQNPDVISVARALLGKVLCSNFDHRRTSGIITEVEAYMAPEDKASHAFNNRMTARTEAFYEEGGILYVYLCYGIHHLTNFITGPEGIPHAVLIRSIEPLDGFDVMRTRRKLKKWSTRISTGPGCVSQAMGITTENNKMHLAPNKVWVESRDEKLAKTAIVTGPRVGVDYAEEWATKPLRFGIKDSRWISRPAFS